MFFGGLKSYNGLKCRSDGKSGCDLTYDNIIRQHTSHNRHACTLVLYSTATLIPFIAVYRVCTRTALLIAAVVGNWREVLGTPE